MSHPIQQRRNVITGSLGALAAVSLGGAAQAQPTTPAPATASTWDRITQTKVLRAGAALQEPWYFKDTAPGNTPGAVKSGNDTWRGVGPVIAAEIAKALGVQLEIVEVAWGNASAGLQTNQFDLMLCLDGNPTRALALDFVPTPLLWYPMAALLKPSVSITSWKQANDPKLRWGVILGSSSDTNLTRRASKAQITRFQNANEMYAAFQSGRLDGIFSLGPTLELVRSKVGVGKMQLLSPRSALAAGVAIRQESDQRWKSYLTTAVSYFYNSGATQAAYEEFLEYRGIDPKTVTPIVRENWS